MMLRNLSLPFLADCVQILPLESVHRPVTVGSLSDRIRENRDAVGTDSVIF